jgi:hypothetical protein
MYICMYRVARIFVIYIYIYIYIYIPSTLVSKLKQPLDGGDCLYCMGLLTKSFCLCIPFRAVFKETQIFFGSISYCLFLLPFLYCLFRLDFIVVKLVTPFYFSSFLLYGTDDMFF